MKIIFKVRKFWGGEWKETVPIEINKSGHPSLKSWRDLIRTMKELKKAEVIE